MTLSDLWWPPLANGSFDRTYQPRLRSPGSSVLHPNKLARANEEVQSTPVAQPHRRLEHRTRFPGYLQLPSGIGLGNQGQLHALAAVARARHTNGPVFVAITHYDKVTPWQTIWEAIAVDDNDLSHWKNLFLRAPPPGSQTHASFSCGRALEVREAARGCHAPTSRMTGGSVAYDGPSGSGDRYAAVSRQLRESTVHP